MYWCSDTAFPSKGQVKLFESLYYMHFTHFGSTQLGDAYDLVTIPHVVKLLDAVTENILIENSFDKVCGQYFAYPACVILNI